MLERIPTEAELAALCGEPCADVAHKLRLQLATDYDLESFWDQGGKAATYQCRYRRGGKTLCTLLYKPGEAACMIVFGGAERDRIQGLSLAPETRAIYDAATTYHDGKWVWFPLDKQAVAHDLRELLAVKRKRKKNGIE